MFVIWVQSGLGNVVIDIDIDLIIFLYLNILNNEYVLSVKYSITYVNKLIIVTKKSKICHYHNWIELLSFLVFIRYLN